MPKSEITAARPSWSNRAHATLGVLPFKHDALRELQLEESWYAERVFHRFLESQMDCAWQPKVLPEIMRFKGLGEISPTEFAQFIGKDMRLSKVEYAPRAESLGRSSTST